MNRKLMLIVLVVALLSVTGVAAASGLLRWYSLGAGRVVEMVPLEDGSVAILQSNPNLKDFNLIYMSDGKELQRYSVPWVGNTEPTVLVRACQTTIHLALTSAEGQSWYVEWQLPIEVERVYLPLVCGGKHD